ncbi:virion structural protein [Pseudomonas phage Phabio]|uniref:Virion structural protein n=1 Tax=Pseudomonas phage Phabio TaxID=2006668 RepID=A0A1Y0T1X0_9CAUD|nr:virion structural protein [Pseudomonas phage Phabio]ARV76837.1 virion structural protein [Pseudomonas phage Phabio]
MVPILHPLPLDWTGQATSNVVTMDSYDIMDQADEPYKVVVLDKGYFYLHDLVVMNHLQKPLLYGEDYQCIAMNKDVVTKTGFNACAVIVIKNPQVNNKVFVTARMVGGEYCALTDAVIDMANGLLAGGKRKVYWKNIYGKPNDYRPNGHQHAWWELFGFTEATKTIKRMRVAQQISTAKDFQGVYDSWRAQYNNMSNLLKDIEARLTTHINDTFDPHVVTKTQIGLSLVFNGAPATFDETRAGSGTLNNSYATPLRAKQSFEYNFLPQLEQHENDFNNPHRDSYQSLNTYSVTQLQQKGTLYYNKGSTVKYTARYGGHPWDDIYTGIRNLVPIGNITSGVLKMDQFSDMLNPPVDYILSPTVSGTPNWRSIREVLTQHVKKGNQVFYVAGTFGYDLNGIANIFNQIIGPKPAGSIGVFRYQYGHGTSSGNGGITVYLPNISFVRCNGSTWTT